MTESEIGIHPPSGILQTEAEMERSSIDPNNRKHVSAFIIPCFQTIKITSVIKHVVTNITVVIASPANQEKLFKFSFQYFQYHNN